MSVEGDLKSVSVHTTSRTAANLVVVIGLEEAGHNDSGGVGSWHGGHRWFI